MAKLNEFEDAPYDDNSKVKEAILYTGFIAQEVEAAAEEAGYDFSAVVKPQNEKSQYNLSYSTFTVPLVKAVQELKAQNEALQSRIEALEAKLNI